jgi:predicted MPP superfamily phosphohydrolase
MRPRHLARSAGLLAAAGAVAGYASVIERNWFVLRRFDVPVLPAGARPVRVLHISDVHLTPGRARLLSWIRSLDATDPDLVVNTGDSIAHTRAVQPFLDALGPLLDRPGMFVYGSNDLFSPMPKNPARYLWRTSASDHQRHVPDLPWAELGAGMAAAGWLDLNNRHGRIKAGDLDIEVAGVHDSHIKRDRYAKIAGRADPAADLRLGCSTGSLKTATTCCSRGTRTAARCACPGSGRW